MSTFPVTGPSHDAMDEAAQQLVRRVESHLRSMRVVLQREFMLTGQYLPTLNRMRVNWREYVNSALMPFMERKWLQAADITHRQLTAGVRDAVTAAAAIVPRVSAAQAASFLTVSNGELNGIGNIAWERVNASMLEGIASGDARKALSDRIMDALDAAMPEADVIARSELRAAMTRGALQQMYVSGYAATKTWLTRGDVNVRNAHAEVNGETVPLRNTFDVQGVHMDGPYDPTAPAWLTRNCRCTLAFDVEIDAMISQESVALAASALNHDQAMIALVPIEADVARLALDGGEAPKELHLTLLFLGQAADLPPDAMDAMVNAITQMLESRGAMQPLACNAFGLAYWNPAAPDPAWVLNVGNVASDDAMCLGMLYGCAESAVMQCEICMPDQHSPWSPHICLAYGAEFSGRFDEMLQRIGSVTFDRVRVAIGNDVTDIPLKSG